MALDPNIILQGQAPKINSPLDEMTKALTLKSLVQQGQLQDQQLAENQGVRSAFKNNIATNPDGTTTLNKNAVLSDLYKVNPSKALDYDKLFQGQELDKLAKDTAIAKQVAWGINDDGSNYQAMRDKAIKLGIPNAEQMPPVFSSTFVNNWRMHTLSGEEQINNRMKEQELGLKQQDMALQRAKLYGGGIQNPGSPGGMAAQAPGGQPTDPAMLVPSYVPEKHQEKAFGEIEAAQNTKANAGKILDSFDNAANNFHGVDVIPGMQNADQKSLHALLGPTFKDVEGTVRQAAMDNMFANITPQFGDDKETIQKKRDALVGYLKSKSSAPVAKGYGIDLSKYPSTHLDDSGGGTVQMRDPQGNIRSIPSDQVDAALKAGGKKI